MIRYILFFLIFLSSVLFSQDILSDFTTDVLGFPKNEIKWIPHKGSTPGEMGYESQIYFLKNKKNEILCVLKVSPSSHQGSREKQCLEKIASLNIEGHSPIKVLGYREYQKNNKTISILGMSRIEGNTLSNLIKKMGMGSPGAFDELKTAVGQCGIVLKDLHNKESRKICAKEYLLNNEKILKTFMKHYEKYHWRISRREFYGLIGAYNQNLYSQTKNLGIIHGDNHPGNIIFDAKTEKITLLDLSDMYPSIISLEEGGLAVEDYVRFLFYLKLMSLQYHIKPKKTDKLEKIFIKNYAGEEQLFSNEEIIYHRMLLTMQIINTLIEKDPSKLGYSYMKRKFFIKGLLAILRNDYLVLKNNSI